MLTIAALAAAVVVIAIGWYCLTAPQQRTEIKVYFFKDNQLFAVERPLKPDEAPLNSALRELLAGPREEDSLRGIETQIPKGTKLIYVKVRGNTAIVNLSRELENYGGGSTRLQGIVAQIIYTATDVPGIDKAWIWMEGEKELVLGGEGLILDHPLGRKDVAY